MQNTNGQLLQIVKFLYLQIIISTKLFIFGFFLSTNRQSQDCLFQNCKIVVMNILNVVYQVKIMTVFSPVCQFCNKTP